MTRMIEGARKRLLIKDMIKAISNHHFLVSFTTLPEGRRCGTGATSTTGETVGKNWTTNGK